MRAVAEVARRPLSCLLVQVNDAPDRWRETLDGVQAARRAGMEANCQVGCRPIGVLMGLETSRHPFDGHPAWQDLAALDPKQRLQRLRRDRVLRAGLVGPLRGPDPDPKLNAMLSRTFLIGAILDYEPDPSMSLVAQAEAQGHNPRELALDLILADNGTGLRLHTFENYSAGNLDVVREMLLDDATVMEVADGGAHVGVICDASAPTFLLSHWGWDRRRGPGLPLEFLVKKHTSDTAAAYGLNDRGVLAPGMRADVNVIDFERPQLTRPEIVYDLPAGGRRLMQRARGYRHVFLRGIETMRDDTHTGNLPGRLVRGPRPRPRSYATGRERDRKPCRPTPPYFAKSTSR